MKFAQCANDLNELSLHYKLDGHSRKAREYQLASSELQTLDFMPPDPSELDRVSVRVRDHIAEWMAFGEIEELQEYRETRPYMSNLTEIAKIGPKTAKAMHEETGAETIDDVKQLDDEDKLQEVTGIGPKTATTIRRSIAQR